MKLSSKIMLLPVLALLASSCSTTPEQKELTVNLSEEDIPFVNNAAVKIASVVKFEDSAGPPLSFITRALKGSGHYYLIGKTASGDQVYRYDADGHYKGTVGQIGNGPGEYTSASDIGADFENDRFYVLDSGKKIVVYNAEGSHQQDYHLNISSSFAVNQQGQFVHYTSLDQGYGITLTDHSGTVLQEFLRKDTQWQPIQENHFHHNGNDICFREAFSNTIYHLGDTTARPYVTFNWGEKNYLPEYDQLDLMGIYQAFAVEGKFRLFSGAIVGDTKIYASFSDQKEGISSHIIYNIPENKVSGFKTRHDQGLFFAMFMNEEQQPGFFTQGVFLKELFATEEVEFKEEAMYLVFLEIG
ncbi:MAG: 6-bladed beta-propeller [Bacteroidales bacterium]